MVEPVTYIALFSKTLWFALDFDELQEFPKISSWATKSDFISDLMGTKNHQKTLYFPWFPGSLYMGIRWQLDYYIPYFPYFPYFPYSIMIVYLK